MTNVFDQIVEMCITLIVPVGIPLACIILYFVGKKRHKKNGPPQEIEPTTFKFTHLGYDLVLKITSSDMVKYRKELAEDGFACIFVTSELSAYREGLMHSLCENVDSDAQHLNTLNPDVIRTALDAAKNTPVKKVVIINTDTADVPDIPNLDNLLADAVSSASDAANLKVLFIGDKASYKRIVQNTANPLSQIITDNFDICAAEAMCHNALKVGRMTPYPH